MLGSYDLRLRRKPNEPAEISLEQNNPIVASAEAANLGEESELALIRGRRARAFDLRNHQEQFAGIQYGPLVAHDLNLNHARLAPPRLRGCARDLPALVRGN